MKKWRGGGSVSFDARIDDPPIYLPAIAHATPNSCRGRANRQQTVRKLIHDGKLGAMRIGKQYRISAADLNDFVGEDSRRSAAPTRTRRVLVSTIVDIDAISREESDRVTTMATAVLKAPSADPEGRRLDCIYYPEQGSLRVVINGSTSFASSLLGLVDTILADGRRA